MKGKPVVSSPTEFAAHRVYCEHAQQAIDGAQFSLLEFDRIAAWTLSSKPKQLRQPSGPISDFATHCFRSSRYAIN
jgi:hypothetical protein